jgi:hypothetical protein
MSDPVFLGDDFILCDLSSPLFLHLIDDHQPTKRKPKRRPSAANLAKAAKEGVEVKLAPDGTITMTPVKPVDVTPIDDDTSGNEWDSVLQ